MRTSLNVPRTIFFESATMWMLNAALVVGRETDALPRPPPSIKSDEQAIYETALSSWLGQKETQQFVNLELSAAPSMSDQEIKECGRQSHFSKGQAGRASLAGIQFQRKGIMLIDGSQWSSADPSSAITNGKSVEVAVEQGFRSSMISFSRIAFSRNGNDALVRMGMVCGMLCGSGSTLHFHKSFGRWTIIHRCGRWIS